MGDLSSKVAPKEPAISAGITRAASSAGHWPFCRLYVMKAVEKARKSLTTAVALARIVMRR